MSPTIIAGLLLAGFFLLVVIAYINNIVENHKLKVGRQRAALVELIRRCSILAVSLPDQIMTSKLKKTLVAMELHWAEQLLRTHKSNDKLRDRIERLHADGGAVEHQEPRHVSISIRSVSTEAQFQEIRFALEDFYSLASTAGQNGILSHAEVRYWHQEVRRLLAQMYLDYLNNVVDQSLQRNQLNRARQFCEQAVKYLTKKQDFPDRQVRIDVFNKKLEYITRITAEQQAKKLAEASPLNTLAEEENRELDGEWHKKNFYE